MVDGMTRAENDEVIAAHKKLRAEIATLKARVKEREAQVQRFRDANATVSAGYTTERERADRAVARQEALEAANAELGALAAQRWTEVGALNARVTELEAKEATRRRLCNDGVRDMMRKLHGQKPIG